MKNLSVLLVIILLFSCSNNQVNISNISKENIISIELAKNLEEKLNTQFVSGISTDSLGNTYIITNHAKILKVDKSSHIINFKENSYYWGSVYNLFFKVDSKGNGYFIPETVINSTLVTDPVTGGLKDISRNLLQIYKISNLKITDMYDVQVEGFRFRGYCLSDDDCSDLNINLGGKNNSLDEFLKSKKQFIENNNSNIGTADKYFFGSNGNGLYITEDNNTNTLYTYIDGVKKTDISTTPAYNMVQNIDDLGNGYIIYNHEGKNKYLKIQNFVIVNTIELNSKIDDELYKQMYFSVYSTINDKGNGFIVYYDNLAYNFSKINDFKINNKKEVLSDSRTAKKIIDIDSNGNGYLAFNRYMKPQIFIIRNNNLIYQN